jgi:hypothetical protein
MFVTKLHGNVFSVSRVRRKAWTDRRTKIVVLKIRKEGLKLAYFNTV